MMRNGEKLRLTSFWSEIRDTRFGTMRSDIIAGLTCALLALPQAMAYAILSGLPVSVGIFSAIFGVIFSALFGHSRHLCVGPTNTVAILIQLGISQILYTYYRDLDPAMREAMAMRIMIQITLCVGAIQLGFAFTKMGKLAQFVGRPVVVGYIMGAAAAIFVSQGFTFLGISSQDALGPLIYKLGYLITHLKGINLFCVIIGGLSLALIIGLKKLNKHIPAAAATFAFAALITWALRLPIPVAGDYGQLHTIGVKISIPYISIRIFSDVLAVAFAIALLGILEVTSIVKSMAARSGQSVEVNQEILGFGIANTASAFFGAMPSSGSFSRSSVLWDSGGTTRFAAVFSGLFVWAIVVGMGRLVGTIPLAALSALLYIAAFTMVDWKQALLCFRATTTDRMVMLVTLTFCLLFSLDVAFYTGVIISVGLYLKQAAAPSVREMTIGRRGNMRPRLPNEERLQPGLRIIDVHGELFFGAVDFFQQAMRAICDSDDIDVVILRLKNALHLDATACIALRQIHRYLQEHNQHLILCGVKQRVFEVLDKSGLMDEIGRDNVFRSDPIDEVGSTGQALHRAEMITVKVDEGGEDLPDAAGLATS